MSVLQDLSPEVVPYQRCNENMDLLSTVKVLWTEIEDISKDTKQDLFSS
jgi:hypothetical protein